MKKLSHPYTIYEKQAIWPVLDQAIRSLVKNGDLTEQTARQYIVGYLAQQLTEAGFQRVSELRTGQRTLRVVEVTDPRKIGAA